MTIVIKTFRNPKINMILMILDIKQKNIVDF